LESRKQNSYPDGRELGLFAECLATQQKGPSLKTVKNKVHGVITLWGTPLYMKTSRVTQISQLRGSVHTYLNQCVHVGRALSPECPLWTESSWPPAHGRAVFLCLSFSLHSFQSQLPATLFFFPE
jgi:hypothetical protein